MWVFDLIFSIIVSLVFAGLLFIILKPTAAEEGDTTTLLVFFFLTLLLPIWAGGVWLGPIGPAVFGVYALPFIFVGLGIALLLAATAPPSRSAASPRGSGGNQTVEDGSLYAFGAFFWVFVLTLLIFIVIGYLAAEPINAG